jgi:hypothetical protein
MATATDTLKIINTPDNTKVIKVQEGSLPGQKGDTPDKSIYSVRTVVADSPSLVIDASLATTFYIKLQSSVNLTVINWPNDSKSQRIALYFEQDENGERNVLLWPGACKWSYGQVPVLTPIPNAVDCIVLDTFNSGVTIFGGIVGLGYS